MGQVQEINTSNSEKIATISIVYPYRSIESYTWRFFRSEYCQIVMDSRKNWEHAEDLARCRIFWSSSGTYEYRKYGIFENKAI